ncbi:MAG: serine/threonine-protein kinase [Acidobacteriota bacterium]
MSNEPAGLAGKMLSHYEIESRLGAGGMGEVYLARDTRLDRHVALKVLPQQLASDRDRMGRFMQEAKAASALSHPNLAHIYEIGEHEGVWFIAMERIEGETLDRQLAGRRMDVAEICDVGSQLADVLSNAHSRGIIHRDIKPANIMLTARGQAKVLDFGIAKVQGDPITMIGDERTTKPLTAAGMVMGTVNYMSPEQALGRKVDHRSDLFSLGVVLYQMASGRPPFVGETPSEIIDRLLHAEPEPPGLINARIPSDLERIILKCIRKDPADRYQSAADLGSDLAYLRKQITGGRPAATQVESEYYVPRSLARWLFVLAQALYLGMYLSALRWADSMTVGLQYAFGRFGEIFSYYFIVTALIGMGVRLFLASLVIFDHTRTGVEFRKAFPAILFLDATWSAAPLSLANAWGPIPALACVPPLAFLPFSQRTLIRSAYDLTLPRRTSTGRRPAVDPY